MNQSELARRSGLTTGPVSNYLSNTSRPNPISCLKIARGLEEDPVKILRLAGHTGVADLIEWFIPERRVDRGLVICDPEHAELHRKIQRMIEEGSDLVSAILTVVRIWERRHDQSGKNRSAK